MVVNLVSLNEFAYLILELRVKQDMTQIRSFILGRRVGGDSWLKAKVFQVRLPGNSSDILLLK